MGGLLTWIFSIIPFSFFSHLVVIVSLLTPESNIAWPPKPINILIFFHLGGRLELQASKLRPYCTEDGVVMVGVTLCVDQCSAVHWSDIGQHVRCALFNDQSDVMYWSPTCPTCIRWHLCTITLTCLCMRSIFVHNFARIVLLFLRSKTYLKK